MAKKQKDEMKKDSKENSGKGKGILLAVLVLVVIGIGTFGGVYFYMQSKDAAEPKVEAADYALLSDTTLNLSDENGKCYLKTSLTLSYDSNNKDLIEELEKKKISIQDASIWYLKSRKAADFAAANERELKQGLVNTINNILEKGSILDVYLMGEEGTGFVVQKV